MLAEILREREIYEYARRRLNRSGIVAFGRAFGTDDVRMFVRSRVRRIDRVVAVRAVEKVRVRHLHRFDNRAWAAERRLREDMETALGVQVQAERGGDRRRVRNVIEVVQGDRRITHAREVVAVV